MKILFVSHSRDQSVVTVKLEKYEIHLYNQGGHTELWSIAETYENALEMHRQLCLKCNIPTNI